jgi:HK97 gp10 family phage protein
MAGGIKLDTKTLDRDVRNLLKKLDRIAGTGSKGRREAKGIMRKAIRAGAAPMRKSIKSAVPVNTGVLKKSMFVKVKQYPSGVSVGIIGPRVRGKNGKTASGTVAVRGIKFKTELDAFYAHMVEKGTKPHVIKPRNGRALHAPLLSTAEGSQFVGSVQHPGTRPQPFITKGLKGGSKASAAAFGKKLGDEIRKQAKKK